MYSPRSCAPARTTSVITLPERRPAAGTWHEAVGTIAACSMGHLCIRRTSCGAGAERCLAAARCHQVSLGDPSAPSTHTQLAFSDSRAAKGVPCADSAPGQRDAESQSSQVPGSMMRPLRRRCCGVSLLPRAHTIQFHAPTIHIVQLLSAAPAQNQHMGHPLQLVNRRRQVECAWTAQRGRRD
eukprot:TRINITY_DN1118_c0_g1_i1.p3 TRINITY_DN1118_c0_g1~~TRINITY_DN1118_c0_g1_i1.p3  ORF type:complete len:183 (+),score=5.95 TRINITY_DN1118_c0_g1_i1:611-1159(+)